MNKEITFIVQEAEEGGYYAESVGVAIFAEGETIQELKESVKSGIECYYDSITATPSFVHLHFVKDEVFAL